MANARAILATGAIGLALSTAGCTLGPDFERPEAAVPQQFAFAGDDPVEGPLDEAMLANWWTAFADPVLTGLVEQAQSASPDIAIAGARIEKARAQLAAADAAGLPQIGAMASGNVTRLSKNAGFSTLASAFGGGSSGSGSGSGGSGGGQGIGLPGSTFETYAVGFDASWEPDLFGAAKRGREAARAAYNASVYDRQGALNAIAAEVARTYFAYRSLDEQAKFAAEQVAQDARRRSLTVSQIEAGLVSADTLPPVEIALAQTQNQLAALEGQRSTTIASLATLVNAPVRDVQQALASAREQIWTVPIVPPGTPADLVRRRPDIAVAEAQLAMATAQIGVAKASLFPRLSLSGVAEFLSTGLANLISSDSVQLAASGQLGFPVLDFGAGDARVKGAEADAQIAYYQYQKQVLVALGEVEQALVALRTARVQRGRVAFALEQAQRSASAAEAAFEGGLTNGIPVTQAKASLAELEGALVQADAAVANASVALFKALGGGWPVAEAGEPAER